MEPIDDFIPRTVTPDIQNTLETFSDWLREIVNFGSNLAFWDIKAVVGGDEILPPILFLRNFLEYIDACSVLVRQSCIEPCNTILRTILENFLYIEYLLEERTIERSRCFLVWNAFENKKLYLSMDGKSDPYKKIEAAFKRDKLLNDQKPYVLPGIEKNIKNNDLLLKAEENELIVEEYFRTKNKLNKNPNWYSLYNGPRNIEKLAERLGFITYYEILYRGLSSSTHGTSIIQGKVTRNIDKGIDIYQIRLPTGAQTVTSLCVTLSTSLFKTYIQKRLSDKKSDFEAWINEIQPIFKALETRDLIKIH